MVDRKVKGVTLAEMKDRHLGKIGTPKRDQYEFKLKTELIGEMIRKIRKERKLTQEQLGDLLGVQKAQISKLEHNASDIKLSTVEKVFKALNTDMIVTMKVNASNTAKSSV